MDGALGYGNTDNVGDDETVASAGYVPICGPDFPGNLAERKEKQCRAVQVSAGGRHTCALLESGRVRCWGRNAEGQLGVGSRGGPVAHAEVGRGCADSCVESHLKPSR